MTRIDRTLVPRSRVWQRGLTLIELMVALTLGLFLTLGLMLMMSDSSRTFKIQDDYARLQENAVSGLNYVSDSLRHAGFFGNLTDTATTLQAVGALTITSDCGNTFTNTVPVFGYASLTTANVNTALPCIAAANFRPGPVLIARLATGYPVPDPNNDGNPNDGFGTVNAPSTGIYVQADVVSGQFFVGTGYAGMVTANTVKKYASDRHFPVFPYQMHVYYIRPCSRPTGAGSTCLAADDGGRPIPTLVRQELQASAMVERPLAEGVERISLLYGLDSIPAGTGDGIADRFVADPLSIAADGWQRVVAVRVALLVRTPNPVPGYDDSGKNYDLDGNGTTDFNCTASGEANACTYKRAIFSQVIQVRNVAYRRGA